MKLGRDLGYGDAASAPTSDCVLVQMMVDGLERATVLALARARERERDERDERKVFCVCSLYYFVFLLQ